MTSWLGTGKSLTFFYSVQCVTRGWRGSGCVESIYRSYTLCIWPDSKPTKLIYPELSNHDRLKPIWVWLLVSAAPPVTPTPTPSWQLLPFFLAAIAWNYVLENTPKISKLAGIHFATIRIKVSEVNLLAYQLLYSGGLPRRCFFLGFPEVATFHSFTKIFTKTTYRIVFHKTSRYLTAYRELAKTSRSEYGT